MSCIYDNVRRIIVTLLYFSVYEAGAQPRFQSWGSNSLVYNITTLLQKKTDRCTQFGAVGYIITLYSSKSYVNVGVRPNFREVRIPPTPSVVAPLGPFEK